MVDQVVNHQIDSMFIALDTIKDRKSAKTIADQLWSKTVRNNAWNYGYDALYQKMVNADWENDTFYNELKVIYTNEDIPDSISSIALYYMAYLDFIHGKIETSKKLHKEYVQFCVKSKVSTCKYGAFDNLGNMAIIDRDYDLARDYFNFSFNSKTAQDSLTSFNHYCRLGYSHFYQNHFKKALKYYQIAGTYKDYLDQQYYFYLAKCLNRLEESSQAKSVLFKLKEDQLDNKGRFFFYAILSDIYISENKLEKGLENLTIALDYGSKFYPSGHRELTKVHYVQSDVMFQLQRHEEALNILKKALVSFLPPNMAVLDSLGLPLSEDITSYWVPDILSKMGDIYLKRMRTNFRQKDLKCASQFYSKASDLYQTLGLQLSYESSDIFLSEHTEDLYGNWISAICSSNLKGELLKDSVFIIIQKAQAYSLKKNSNYIKSLLNSHVSPILADSFQLLSRQIGNILVKKQGGQAVDSIVKLKLKISSLKNRIRKSFPLFYSNIQSDPNLKLKEVRDILNHDEGLVQYYYQDSFLYQMLVLQDTSFFIRSISRHLVEIIEKYNVSISDYDSVRFHPKKFEDLFLNSSHQLYCTLLDDLLDKIPSNREIKKLTISTSGVLSSVSFDALMIKPSTSWLESENYLINHYAVDQALLIADRITDGYQASIQPKVLSVGVNYRLPTIKKILEWDSDSQHTDLFQKRMGLDKITPLYFAVKEAKMVNEIYGGTLLINEKATCANFVDEIKEHTWLHFSGHSLLDSNDHFKSCLVFHPTKNKGASVSLTVSELNGIDFNCDHVVLSACQTAAGKQVSGEGVLNMTRYFQMHGASTVIASRWSIPDQPTYKIMKEYYSNQSEGISSTRALQLAKIEYLRNDNLSSPSFRLPIFWAATAMYTRH